MSAKFHFAVRCALCAVRSAFALCDSPLWRDGRFGNLFLIFALTALLTLGSEGAPLTACVLSS